jgi:hypothetical protein
MTMKKNADQLSDYQLLRKGFFSMLLFKLLKENRYYAEMDGACKRHGWDEKFRNTEF